MFTSFTNTRTNPIIVKDESPSSSDVDIWEVDNDEVVMIMEDIKEEKKLKRADDQSILDDEAFSSILDQVFGAKVVGARFKRHKNRMTNAMKKRYKWHLRQGRTIEEARILCREKMPEAKRWFYHKLWVKRRLREKQMQVAKEKNEVQEIIPEHNIIDLTNTTSNLASDRKKMIIIHKDHPRHMITASESQLIQEALLDVVVELRKRSVKPNFLASEYDSGCLTLECANSATVAWLRQNIDRARLWEGAKIKLVEADAVPKSKVLTASFDNSAGTDTNRILGLIDGQNSGLKACSWSVLKRTVVGEKALLTVAVDTLTFDNLRKNDFLIHYRFGQIKMRVEKNIPEEGETSNTGHIETPVPEDQFIEISDIRSEDVRLSNNTLQDRVKTLPQELEADKKFIFRFRTKSL